MTSTSNTAWTLYGGYTDSVTIPYSGYTAKASSPQVALSIDGGASHNFTIDTGSLGLVVPVEDVPQAVRDQGGTPGKIGYSSSGLAYSGFWTTTSVSFTNAQNVPLTDSAGNVLTEQLPVLVVTQSYADGQPLSGDQGAPTQLGVGFGRSPTDQDGVPLTVVNNAFLNLPGEADGTMRAGYIVGQQGVTIGLTTANAGNGWALSKLTPSADTSLGAGGATNWATPTAVLTVNGGKPATGTELVDTGLSRAQLGWPKAPTGGSTLPDGTTVTTDLLGLGAPYNSVTYSYTLGDGQPQTPPKGGISDGTGTTFSNTTDALLNGLNYLYDAAGGYIGFEPNGSGNAGSTFTQELAASGGITLPDGFSSLIPTVLRSNTTISDTGSADFGGALEGTARLTLTGGGTFTFGGDINASGGIALAGASLALDNPATSAPIAISTIAGTNNLIDVGDNAVTVAAAGNDTIHAGAGTVSVTGGASLDFVGGSGAATVAGGSGNTTLLGGSGGGLYAGGTGGNNLLVSHASNTLLVGGGAGDRLFAAGGDTIVGAAGGETLVGGTGSTLVGADQAALFLGAGVAFGTASGQDTMVSGNASATVVGGAGSDVVFGGKANDQIWAGSGSTAVIGGTGGDLVTLGTGHAMVFAGSGGETLDVLADHAGGQASLVGFQSGRDQVTLYGYDASSVQYGSTGGNATLTLQDGTAITFVGVTPGSQTLTQLVHFA